LKTETIHKVDCYQASGKLLIFGEYLVLNGAKSLAVPVKFGQELKVSPADGNATWKAEGLDGIWFQCRFDEQMNPVETTDAKVSDALLKIFRRIQELRPEMNLHQNFKISANFPLNWGLGSSSTLISLLAQWSQTDPYDLLEKAFGGSGYDIACATANGPITYQIGDVTRKVTEAPLSTEITEKCLFVYFGNKQSSSEAIENYRKKKIVPEDIQAMSFVVDAALRSAAIEDFEGLMNKSEQLLSGILGQKTIKEAHFEDYPYAIKSLGAWGGDFFMATYRELEAAKQYFSQKGFETAFSYNELVIQ